MMGRLPLARTSEANGRPELSDLSVELSRNAPPETLLGAALCPCVDIRGADLLETDQRDHYRTLFLHRGRRLYDIVDAISHGVSYGAVCTWCGSVESLRGGSSLAPCPLCRVFLVRLTAELVLGEAGIVPIVNRVLEFLYGILGKDVALSCERGRLSRLLLGRPISRLDNTPFGSLVESFGWTSETGTIFDSVTSETGTNFDRVLEYLLPLPFGPRQGGCRQWEGHRQDLINTGSGRLPKGASPWAPSASELSVWRRSESKATATCFLMCSELSQSCANGISPRAENVVVAFPAQVALDGHCEPGREKQAGDTHTRECQTSGADQSLVASRNTSPTGRVRRGDTLVATKVGCATTSTRHARERGCVVVPNGG